ncbi:MAG: hypothetical protein JRJ41_02595 [Deltaproteobacteria bacterium]|nr:hypothetical protein [Deltaproteobacteria bacterium]
MKRPFFISLILALVIAFSGIGFCDPVDELIDQFGQEFEAAKPAPNTSVNADYKLDQVALGAFYTTKTLSLIYKQNQALMGKYDQLLMKYDKIIDQNKEIIKLLSIIAEKEGEQK